VPIWRLPIGIWRIGRQFENLLEVQATTRAAVNGIETRLRLIEDRLTRLEAGQGPIISEARAAAGVAATGLASAMIADVVTRITRLEMRQDSLNARLQPPD
jgi:hypothetical protein